MSTFSEDYERVSNPVIQLWKYFLSVTRNLDFGNLLLLISPASVKAQASEASKAADAFTNFKHVLLPITDRNPYLSEGSRQVLKQTSNSFLSLNSMGIMDFQLFESLNVHIFFSLYIYIYIFLKKVSFPSVILKWMVCHLCWKISWKQKNSWNCVKPLWLYLKICKEMFLS